MWMESNASKFPTHVYTQEISYSMQNEQIIQRSWESSNTDAIRHRLKIYPVLWFISANFFALTVSSGASVNKSASICIAIDVVVVVVDSFLSVQRMIVSFMRLFGISRLSFFIHTTRCTIFIEWCLKTIRSNFNCIHSTEIDTNVLHFCSLSKTTKPIYWLSLSTL